MSRTSLLAMLLFAPMLLCAQTSNTGVGGAASAPAAAARQSAAGAQPSAASDEDSPRFMARFLDGSFAYIVQKGAPSRPSVGGNIWFSSDSKVVHRILFDRSSRMYFGYDLRLKSRGDGLKLEVEIQPLRIAPTEIASGAAVIDASYRQFAAIKYPPKQVLAAGETIAIDLLTSADGREKVSDYITVNSLRGVTNGVPADGVLHSVTRRVVVDVVATGHDEKHVHGLSRDSFVVKEDGREQTTLSFEEYPQESPASSAPAAPLPPNTFTNLSSRRINGVFNILVLDYLNNSLSEQMQEFNFVKRFESLALSDRIDAVFVLKDDLQLVQWATPNHSALEGFEINQHVLPYMSSTNPEMRTRLTTQRISELLDFISPVKGRKNLIWLTEGMFLPLIPSSAERRMHSVGFIPTANLADASDPEGSDPTRRAWRSGSSLSILSSPDEFAISHSEEMRQTIDRLVANQVAIYPVCVRESCRGGYSTMNRFALDTGGVAYFNSNALGDAIAASVRNGSEYYSLSYSPSDKKFNGELRKIRVENVDKDLRLSYRRNYLADDLALAQPERQSEALRDSVNNALPLGMPAYSELIFTAGLTAIGPLRPPTDEQLSKLAFYDAFRPSFRIGGGLLGLGRKVIITGDPLKSSPPAMQGYAIDYSLFGDQLAVLRSEDGASHVKLECVIVAYNAQGRKVYALRSRIEERMGDERVRAIHRDGYHVRQTVSLPQRESAWLKIILHDLNGRRLGSIEVRLPLREVASVNPQGGAPAGEEDEKE